MHPLGLDRALLARPADFGVGYSVDLNRRAALQAGYLEGSWHFAQGRVGDREGRLGARMQARLQFDRGTVGPSLAAQLTAEWAGFSENTFSDDSSDGGNFGYMFGENGVALFLEGAWFRLGSTEGWTASGGVLLRLPAIVGFAWSWLK